MNLLAKTQHTGTKQHFHLLKIVLLPTWKMQIFSTVFNRSHQRCPSAMLCIFNLFFFQWVNIFTEFSHLQVKTGEHTRQYQRGRLSQALKKHTERSHLHKRQFHCFAISLEHQKPKTKTNTNKYKSKPTNETPKKEKRIWVGGAKGYFTRISHQRQYSIMQKSCTVSALTLKHFNIAQGPINYAWMHHVVSCDP